MPFSVKLMKELDKLEPYMKSVMLELPSEIERNRKESVTRKEFLEFARHTDENFQKVWKSIGELADAQKRTEERVKKHFKAPVFPVTTAYTYHPEADSRLAAAGIAHYWSYQLFKD